MIAPERMSLGDLRALAPLVPDLAWYAELMLAESFDEYVKALYSDIDRGIAKMEDDPGLRKNDGEDRLTAEIALYLSGRGYKVSHDEKIGGHCDLVVRHPQKAFRWLGEAKIHRSGYDYLLKGFNQLCTRYARGSANESQGGLIIYIRNPNASSIMTKWRAHLGNEKFDGYQCEDCPAQPGLAFFSTHTHQTSGLPYRVRHRAVMLHFDPQDK